MTLFEWISNYYKRIYLTADITGFTPWPSPYSDRLCQCLATEKGKSRKRCHVVSNRGFSITLSCSCRGMPRASPSCLSWISEMTVHTLKNMIEGVCGVLSCQVTVTHSTHSFIAVCMALFTLTTRYRELFSILLVSAILSSSKYESAGVPVVMSYIM